MIADIMFPGSVVVLKAIFKVSVERVSTRVDYFKAALSFPVDIIFMSFSFVMSAFTFMQTRQNSPASTKEVLASFTIFIIASLLVTILCRKSDLAFDQDQNKLVLFFAIISWFLSMLALGFSLKMLGVI